MSVYNAAWYDEVMLEPGPLAPVEVSPWRGIYAEVANWIDPDEAVVELGCGTGRFLKLLDQRDHIAPMTGVDWSSAALKEAREYVGDHVKWQCLDLNDWTAESQNHAIVYVCLEVLEHLENDRELVAKVPAGARLLLSVPTFWDDAHVRVFEDLTDIRYRYGRLLDFRRWVMVGRTHHVCETRRW